MITRVTGLQPRVVIVICTFLAMASVSVVPRPDIFTIATFLLRTLGFVKTRAAPPRRLGEPALAQKLPGFPGEHEFLTTSLAHQYD